VPPPQGVTPCRPGRLRDQVIPFSDYSGRSDDPASQEPSATRAATRAFYRHIIDNAEQHGERLSPEGKRMRRDRTTSYAALTIALLGPSLCCPPTTSADPVRAFWNGRYAVTRYLEQKSGTSLAAQQPEGNSTDVYTMSTTCTATGCVATDIDGPPPKNPTLPPRAHYTWDGTQWVKTNDWQWNCLKPDGSVEWDPTRSSVTYKPQPDGTLLGASHNEIQSGTCRGTVDVTILAVPA
jgi:hypothetical protein